MRAAGLGALLQDRPTLDAGCLLALEVWAWLEGWHPERLPLAVEWFDVRDPDRLVDDLLIIREEIAKK